MAENLKTGEIKLGGTDQFTSTTDHGRKCFEAYVTVVNLLDGSPHFFLGAPSLEALAEHWDKFARNPFNPEKAQHVLIMQASRKVT